MWVQRLAVPERGPGEKPPDWDWPWEGERRAESAEGDPAPARPLTAQCSSAGGAVQEPFWEEDEEEAEEEEEGPGGTQTFCGLRRAFLCPEPSARLAPDCPLRGFALPWEQPPRPTAEEAARNAEELVAEEERLKRRAEKKRLRRRRRKDRRRQAGGAEQVPAQDGAAAESPGRESPEDAPGSGGLGQAGCEGSSASPGRSSEDEAEELDLSSTFVSKARLKVGSRPPQRKGKAASPARKEEEEAQVGQEVPEPPAAPMNPVEQSLVLADCGNETAKRGGYQEAVLLFTEAVKLNPREYRFFGNRSFCYEKLQCYPEALRDAQLALSLQPGWPKGLFRQGKALMGLQRYAEAAKTFEELLRLNSSRYDAAIQLEKCRAQLLLNGFSLYNPLKWNVLTRGVQPQGAQPPSQLLMSIPSQAEGRLAPVTITSSKCRTLPPPVAPAPVRERFPVWVGNLAPQITQETLQYYFQPFGPIDSIRRLPQRFCAFVNYTSQEAAEAAFRALQGMEVGGSKFLLQLKHPVHATPVPTKAPSSP